jgi:hypothetical protein
MKHLKCFKDVANENAELHASFINRNSSAGAPGQELTPAGPSPTKMSQTEYDRKVKPALKTLRKKRYVLKQSGRKI